MPLTMDLKARCAFLGKRACRQKLVVQTDTHTHLNRCLTTMHMTAIGLGSTIGVGIYVLLGVAIKDYAGPGVLLSFVIAGLVVLTNAMIYAEFGSYIPHTGAAYTYIYRVLGELAAFLTGWMGTLSLLCSAATGARAWSGFVDSLFNNSIQNFFDDKIGQMNVGPPFSRSLDLMACAFFLVVTLVVSCNVQCSSIINTVLAILTTGVLVFVSVAGPLYGDVRRLANSGHGGFLPYGFSGVIAGASAAFFAFNGFDSICISAEEARDPVKSVPRAILIELVIVTVVYCGAAVGTVSLIPYTDIDLRAPIPSAFEYQGVMWAKLLVTIGPIIAITNLSILGLYSQSRISYRMAKDGLLFSKFAYINPKTKVPLLGVIVFGALVSVISLFLELKDLVRFSVLCMLFQYIILAPALVALRVADKDSALSAAPDDNLRQSDDHVLGSLEVMEPNETPIKGRYTALAGSESPSSSPADGDSGTRIAVGRTELASQHVQDPLLSYSYITEGDLGAGSFESGFQRQHNVESLLVNFADRDAELDCVVRPLQTGSQDRNSHSYGDSTLHSNEFGEKIPFRENLTSPNTSSNKARSERSDVDQTSETYSNTINDGNSGESRTCPLFSEPDSDISDLDIPTLHGRTLRGGSRDLVLKRDKSDANGVHSDGSFMNTFRVFYQHFLTTRLCLVLLMVLLAGLSLQLGLGWTDLRRLQPLAIFTTLCLTCLIIYVCEVLRQRCGPGSHQGFKVPLVPYLPALSSFLNMLLLVSAADLMGIIEFTVLTALGLLIYILMVMTQWQRSSGNNSIPLMSLLQESVNLLDADSDANSEGSL